MWYMNAGVNNSNVSSVNIDDHTISNKEAHSFQQQHYRDNDFVNNNITSTNALGPQYQHQQFHPLQQSAGTNINTVTMTDYGGNMNTATNAMAGMNLVGYIPSSNMGNPVVQQQQHQQHVQQQQQQQYAASMQSNMNGMPNASSMNQNQSSMTANSSTVGHQISSLPPGMALSYGGGAPQSVQQQQNPNPSSLNAAAAAYYNAMQNPYHLTPAASAAAMQAAFASPTPQPGSASMMSMGSGGNGGSSGVGSAMGQSISSVATPNIFSIANPHNDYIWGPRDAFPLRILVTREVVGQVIGKEGKNIRQVQMSSSTRIDVDRVTEIFTPHLETGEIINERKVIIHGDSKQCTAACHGLLVLLLPEELQSEAAQQQVTLRMLAPNALIGRIIGKKGVIIKQIMQETRTRITVHDNGIYDQLGTVADRIVSISGNLDDVCQCENQVSERLRVGFEEFGGLEGVYQSHQQQQTGGYGNAGGGGLLSNSSVYGGFNQGGGGLPTAQQMALAQQQAALLLRSIPGGSLFLSDPNNIYLQNTAAALLGGGGGRAGSSNSNNSSMGGYNSNQYGNNNLSAFGGVGGSIYGSRAAAYQQQLAQRSRGLEYTYVFVPASAVGAIIGTRGANIKQCKMTSGANLTVAPDAEDVGDFKDATIAGKTVQEWRRVTIRGSPDAQYRAQYCLFQSVGNDAGLSPQQLTEVKLRIDIPVPRAAIGRIIGKGGSTVKDIQRVGQVRLAIPDLPPPLAGNNTSNDNTSTTTRQAGGSYNSRRDNNADNNKQKTAAPSVDGKTTAQTNTTSATKAVKKEPGPPLVAGGTNQPARASQNASPHAVDGVSASGDADSSSKIADAEAADEKPIVRKKEKEQVATVVKLEPHDAVDEAHNTNAAAAAAGDAVVVKNEPSSGNSKAVEVGAGDSAVDKTASVNNTDSNDDTGKQQQQQEQKSTKIAASEGDSSDTTPSPTVDTVAAESSATAAEAGEPNRSSNTKQQDQQQQSDSTAGTKPGADNGGSTRTGPVGSSFNNSSTGNSNNSNSNNRQQQSGYGGRYNNNNNNNNSNTGNYYDGRRSGLDRDHDSYYQHRANPNIALVQVTGFFGACQYAQDQIRTYVQAVLMSQIQQEEQQQYYDKQRYDRRDRGGGGEQRGGGAGGQQRPQRQQQPNASQSQQASGGAASTTAAPQSDSTKQQPQQPPSVQQTDQQVPDANVKEENIEVPVQSPSS